MSKEIIDSKIVVVMMVKMGTIVREVIMGILEIEDKVEELSEVIWEVEVKEEVDLTKVQMLEGQE